MAWFIIPDSVTVTVTVQLDPRLMALLERIADRADNLAAIEQATKDLRASDDDLAKATVENTST